jgi:outer membrane protein assembly factor BamB
MASVTSADGASPPKKPAPRVRKRRLAPGLVVQALLAFNLVAIAVARLWIAYQDIALANLITGGGAIACCLVLWIWFVIFSDHRFAWRALTVVLSGALLVTIFSVVREVRFDGEMHPTVYWRWQPVADRLLAAPPAHAASEEQSPEISEEVGFPQFLGPDRNAYLPEPRLVRDWQAHPPREKWRVKIGAGWSGFVAHSGLAITLEQRGDSELITAYDVDSGEILWSHAVETRHDEVMGGVGPRSTPTIDGQRVYALGATGVLSCLDFRTGKLIWSDDLRKRSGATEDDATLVQWGRSNSPLVVAEKVIVPLGGKKGHTTSLIAYHKETGDVLWTGGEQQISYSSPVLGTLAGKTQIVILNESIVAGHDPDSGQELWRFQWTGHSNADASVSQPHLLPGDQIFISKGYQAGAKLLKIVEHDGKFAAELVWENPRVLKTKFTNCALIGDYAYGLSDSTLECVNWKTGDSEWKKGRYGQGQLLGIGDLLLVQAEPGYLALVEASPEKFTEVARIDGLSDKTWNNPCLYHNLLLVRNSVEAVCYEVDLVTDDGSKSPTKKEAADLPGETR